jgi:hypothetical protein
VSCRIVDEVDRLPAFEERLSSAPHTLRSWIGFAIVLFHSSKAFVKPGGNVEPDCRRCLLNRVSAVPGLPLQTTRFISSIRQNLPRAEEEIEKEYFAVLWSELMDVLTEREYPKDLGSREDSEDHMSELQTYGFEEELTEDRSSGEEELVGAESEVNGLEEEERDEEEELKDEDRLEDED